MGKDILSIIYEIKDELGKHLYKIDEPNYLELITLLHDNKHLLEEYLNDHINENKNFPLTIIRLEEMLWEFLDKTDIENLGNKAEVYSLCFSWHVLITDYKTNQRFKNIYANIKKNNQDETQKQDELTDREIIYYKKAIEKGFAEKTDTGYQWLYNNGTIASLAHFLKNIFNPDETQRTPFARLEKLWGVKRLDNATYQLLNTKYKQKWKEKIDNLFED